jgi:hypothetical protein
VRFLIDASAHQIGQVADDGGGNDKIHRRQQFDKGLELIAYAQKLDAAGQQELGEGGRLPLLEQHASGWHAMQQSLPRQRVQRFRRDLAQPRNLREGRMGRRPRPRNWRACGRGGRGLAARSMGWRGHVDLIVLHRPPRVTGI